MLPPESPPSPPEAGRAPARDEFSLLVKPASGDCNLRCDYCFYLEKRGLFGPGAHRMGRDTLEATTRAFLACPMPTHAFAWQGGEPTLMGLDFFREAVAMQRRFAPPGARVTNAIQTNGTLLDDAWAAFLKENGFLVGVSLDGPEAVHDRRRRTTDGAGSYAAAVRGLDALKRHNVDFNVLTLVSDANRYRPEEVYRHLKSLGAAYQQYIECVEFDERGALRPYALAPGQWGEFLCRLFDEWWKADTRRVSVRLFDSILSRLATGRPTMCSLDGNCGGYFVVETNGDVFPCDFHVRPDLRLANVRDAGFSFARLRAAPAYAAFGARKDPRPASPACGACRYLPLCMGDCPKNRVDGRSVLCGDWKRFFGHTLGRFERLAADLAAPAADRGAPPPVSKAAPNAPCPCGSGRKYKKCHGR